jgi:hypothetical protein
MAGGGCRSPDGWRWLGVGLGAHHGRVQVEACHLEPVVAGQPKRQVAESAVDLEDPCAGGGGRRDGIEQSGLGRHSPLSAP